jgi:hypothetical protein
MGTKMERNDLVGSVGSPGTRLGLEFLWEALLICCKGNPAPQRPKDVHGFILPQYPLELLPYSTISCPGLGKMGVVFFSTGNFLGAKEQVGAALATL